MTALQQPTVADNHVGWISTEEKTVTIPDPEVEEARAQQAAAEIQAPTTERWADDQAENRCTATRQLSTPQGEATLRCEGQVGHDGPHQVIVDGQPIRWT